jgi:hypothetical protein
LLAIGERLRNRAGQQAMTLGQQLHKRQRVNPNYRSSHFDYGLALMIGGIDAQIQRRALGNGSCERATFSNGQAGQVMGHRQRIADCSHCSSTIDCNGTISGLA